MRSTVSKRTIVAVGNLTIVQHVFLALMLRFILILYGEWHDMYFDVKYTDIDYRVFTDGARLLVNNTSPFNRDTYRYTPLLAYLLFPNVYLSILWGKILFSLFDVCSGYLIYKITKCTSDDATSKWCAMSWLYNPYPMIISTRGNAESIMSSLILAVILCLLYNKIFIAGIAYGFAIHFKLYPAIYAVSLYFTLITSKLSVKRWKLMQAFFPNKNHYVFFMSAVFSFLVPTYVSFRMFGSKYLEEAFGYHLVRKDIKHNFSPFFYMLYLLDEENYKWLPFITFLPQVALLLLLSSKFKTRKDLPFCIFIQTFVFIALNKVCTSQYFLWYSCLIPIIIPSLNIGLRKGVFMLFVWISGQVLWLYFAYKLEFEGTNCFLLIWLSGLTFYIINMWLVNEMVIYYKN